MILRYTWQDCELKEPSTIENNVLERLENDGILFFFHSTSRSLRFPETSVFRADPFRISETDANRKGFSWMRVIGKSRVFARPHPFRIPFILRFSYMMHLSRPQYLDDFASKFSPRFDHGHCAFAFVENASCGIKCKGTFGRA